MKKGVNYLFSIHRITGCIIAGFFLMWFVTGLILIYHPYPRLTDEQLYEKKEILPSLLPDIQSIKQKAGENIKQLHIRQSQGQTLETVTTADSSFTYCCNDTTVAVKPIPFSFLEETALKWVNAPVIKVDTLHERVQWILYSRYDRAMPIYKFYFDDPEKHELFISGKTGEVQQLTDKSQRLWAWLGAIPHKLYLPFIRKNLDLWDTSITIGGLLCFITSLTGAFVGIYVLLKRHKQKKKWEIPYRKRWYRLHHITGLLFGLFLIAWGISGMISMQRIPQWLINTNGNYIFNSSRMWGKKPLPIDTYELDYRQLKTAYPDLKEVSWTHFRNIPVYTVIVGNRELQIDASTPKIKKLFIPEQTIIEGIQGEEALAEAEKAEDAKNAEEAAEPEVDPKDAKIEELQNRLLRLQADFENFRRRTNIEKEQLSTFVTANVVGKFLKVLDNFERAEASVEKGDNVDAVVDGMKKIRRLFEDAFKDLKVEEIEAQNA